MCGIVGYVGKKQAAPILLSGLRHLEYRGYDSAGIAVANGHGSKVVRCRGKLGALEHRLEEDLAPGNVGIGHTRWATHGRPSNENAHPHKVGPIAVVHNGIIENHARLRARLQAAGRTFGSQTDTEVAAHLIDEALQAGAASLLEAVRRALAQIEGTYALVVLSDDHPGRVIAARKGSPLVLGVGHGEMFLASDAPALLEHTRKVVYLEDGDIAEITEEGAQVFDPGGQPQDRHWKGITWSLEQAEKAGYPHFMLKEIYEQPRVVADTLRGRLLPQTLEAGLDGYELDPATRRIVLVACGTSYHAGLVGKFLIEAVSRIPCEVDLASEFRYREPVVGPDDLVIGISQSGETADTLAALKEAKGRGARTLAISNVVDSAIPRLCDGTLYTFAGPEIGVASTKCFTAQLAALALLAIHAGRRTERLDDGATLHLMRELLHLPHKMSEALAEREAIKRVAIECSQAKDFLYLGRGPNYPIALEGALKLKEISYIHAEGYAAGEMKHGPIALIDDGLPVVIIATRGPNYDKVLSNLEEVRAREGRVVAIATRGDDTIAEHCRTVLWVPEAPPLLQPLLTVLPLQLLAYEAALARGNDVDQPRNLAKSVTVE